MEEYLKSAIRIEWVAQNLILDFQKQGPLINIIRDFSETKIFDNLLVIQGSFDPPLLSHFELICESLSLHQKQYPHAKTALLILLSLSHVEKGTDLFIHSLLGLRVEMFESLLSLKSLNLPWMIGISNSGRYIDLTEAINKYFKNMNNITYIMGIDVFDKLFQGIYYSKTLSEILPAIFQTNYIVAGREDVVSNEDFRSYLQSLSHESQKVIRETNKVSFVPLEKKYQFESATKVRNQLSLDQSVKIPSLPPQILDFIQNAKLYSKNQSILVTQMIIQIFVGIMLERGVDLNKCIQITQKFIKNNITNKNIATRILNEYREKKHLFLEKRCYELLMEHT
ncbi:MAG: hypothetical protein ACXABU_04695 [Candidatus Hodarchaeales archaeon]|jgi:nicotinic acid mononucleotide adenylyltransferase